VKFITFKINFSVDGIHVISIHKFYEANYTFIDILYKVTKTAFIIKNNTKGGIIRSINCEKVVKNKRSNI
jgi:hypothetical protein